ncbi:MAG: site-specific integrase [Chloroflexi bacterium]|nr:site-specific integrase [Chloroflexota bacterium]
MTKKYYEYRLSVDQITIGSLKKEQTHLRYLLEWAQEKPFREVMKIRPSFPEYMLTARMDGEEGQLSAVYIKKTLATARLFFTWLSDNEYSYKRIKQAWIKTVKVKRLSDIPKNAEAVSLEEICKIAASPANSIQERRARAAAVFLYLSGIRIGAFVSLPIQAVDIANKKIIQSPSLGVRTKNSKHAVTFLLDIPELLKVVKDWDNEVRSALPPNGYWFAPLSNVTGKIEKNIVSIGEHRETIARRNIKEWLERVGLPYHSPHKFRHGHIHYGLANSKDVADYKAVSLNVMHSSMKITDQFYSVHNDDEVKKRIDSLSLPPQPASTEEEMIKLLRDFVLWRQKNK